MSPHGDELVEAAKSHGRRGRHQEAAAAARAVTLSAPENAEAWGYHGIVLRRLGDEHGARQSLETALDPALFLEPALVPNAALLELLAQRMAGADPS